MTPPPVVPEPPTPRLTARKVAVALFYGAVAGWTVAGPGGLVAALQEHAADSYGSGWFQYGAFVMQTPGTMFFLMASAWVLPPPAGKRFLRWSLIAWVAVAALQIAMWYAIGSLPGGGC